MKTIAKITKSNDITLEQYEDMVKDYNEKVNKWIDSLVWRSNLIEKLLENKISKIVNNLSDRTHNHKVKFGLAYDRNYPIVSYGAGGVYHISAFCEEKKFEDKNGLGVKYPNYLLNTMYNPIEDKIEKDFKRSSESNSFEVEVQNWFDKKCKEISVIRQKYNYPHRNLENNIERFVDLSVDYIRQILLDAGALDLDVSPRNIEEKVSPYKDKYRIEEIYIDITMTIPKYSD